MGLGSYGSRVFDGRGKLLSPRGTAALTMYLTKEWHARKQVLEAALEVLSDGQPRTSRHILDQLAKCGVTVPKRLVNSVLFSEGRRYVIYDKKAFTYRLRELPEEGIDITVEVVPNMTDQINSRREIKARYIGRNDEYVFTSNEATSPAFFEVSARGSTIEVILNENHPLYTRLDSLLGSAPENDSAAINQQLIQAQECIKLLMVAWAKNESEQPEGPRRFRVEETRLDWGRNARAFLINGLGEEE